MVSFKVICINDADQPNVIPISKRVKEGQDYTVIEVKKLMADQGKLAYRLAEIDLTTCCQPYSFFDARRFAICTNADPVEAETTETV